MPVRRSQPTRSHPTTAPTHVPMAPIAGPGAALSTAPRRQRRSWWRAAATTGVLLVSPHAAAASPLLHESPHELLAISAERDPGVSPIGPWDGVMDAWTSPAALAPGTFEGPWMVEAATLATSLTSDQEALPDGVVEVARYGDVTLVTEDSSLEMVGFHEAADPAALELVPAGDAVVAERGEDLGPVLTLPTRNRGTAPTSAVDLAVRADEPVVAPVTGEVVQVAEFALYGETKDVMIEIRPDDDPDVLVNIVHVAGPSVEVGDRVEAGTSELAASARQLPFDSQIDAFTAVHSGAATPHVHIELRYDGRTV